MGARHTRFWNNWDKEETGGEVGGQKEIGKEIKEIMEKKRRN